MAATVPDPVLQRQGAASEAEPVSVEVGVATSGIDAEFVEQEPSNEQISGAVLDASTHAPIAGIEVCAYEVLSEGLFGACASTDSDGVYAIEKLPSGEYVVEFASPPGSALNYVPQFFKGSSSPSGAQLVSIEWDASAMGIDALLQKGGRVEGKVTSATTSSPLPGVLVCALVSASEAAGCQLTGPAGEYSMVVPPGSYEIGFDAGNSYFAQYYDDRSSFAEAKAVTVALERASGGIDAAMEPAPPPPPPPPPVPAPGNSPPEETTASNSTLPTSTGTGTDAATASLPANNGASATPAQSTGLPGDGKTSTTVTAAGSPLLTLLSSKIAVSKGAATVLVSCRVAKCAGSIVLTLHVLPKHRGSRGSASYNEVFIAKGTFALTPGGEGSVVLRLTLAGKLRLRHARQHPLTVDLALFVLHGNLTTRRVVLG